MKFEALQQEQERIEDSLAMLDSTPQTAEDEGAKELVSKQRAIWIAKLLDDSWLENVTTEMNAFEEDTRAMEFSIFTFFFMKILDTLKRQSLPQSNSLPRTN